MAALRKDYIGAVDLCRPDVADRKSRRTDGRPIHVIAGIAHMRLRAAAPKRSLWAGAEFNTLRLRLIKIAARVVEGAARTRVWLPPHAQTRDVRVARQPFRRGTVNAGAGASR